MKQRFGLQQQPFVLTSLGRVELTDANFQVSRACMLVYVTHMCASVHGVWCSPPLLLIPLL